jgi:hypothetical protein
LGAGGSPALLAWQKVKATGWKKLVNACVGPEHDALMELLESTEVAVAALTDADAEMRDKLIELQGRLYPTLGCAYPRQTGP